MLYVTTRSQADAFTVANTLQNSVAKDGGRFVPRQLQRFSDEELTAWLEKSFGQAVADILNHFFSTKLSGWAVEFALGRKPYKLVSMNHRLIVGEVWHNPGKTYRYAVDSLHRLMAGDSQPTDWTRIAIGIAVLFGLYGQLKQTNCLTEGECVEVAVNAGDFTEVMAAWYAREMGLPIGKIVCTCNENSAPWELLRQGTIQQQTQVHTVLPDVDVAVPANLERLICGTLGEQEAATFAQAMENHRTYKVTAEKLQQLNSGVCVSVVGSSRIRETISKVYRTNQYVLDPYTALAFAGLQDHRATTGSGRVTLLLSDRSPLCCQQAVAQALGITELALNTLL